MRLFYQFGIRLYFVVIYLASFFNKRAVLWVAGRKDYTFLRLTESIWFHFASLGEFEQGRPVLERIKLLYPDNKIVITFFSPSGYEVRKNTPLADAVYYLPLDTEANAIKFIDAIQPKLAVFTKYEYWYFFFKELDKRNIPLYVISAIFRPGQVFFKWYGSLHRKMLGFVAHFFVQDEASKQLLHNLAVNNVTVSGDTRFDRVWANARQPKIIPVIDEFKDNHKIFIAGSTWPDDEKLVATLAPKYTDWKFIIAPHEISEEKIDNLVKLLPAGSVIRYSEFITRHSPFNPHHSPLSAHHSLLTTHQTLIIDNVGMLSSLYQYGEIAYIGGGFGAGIHNTLEAAAFGLPVIFGPNYLKFKEAKDLVAIKAGFSIANEAELKAIANTLINDQNFYNAASRKIKDYVEQHTGATDMIVDYIAKKSEVR